MISWMGNSVLGAFLLFLVAAPALRAQVTHAQMRAIVRQDNTFARHDDSTGRFETVPAIVAARVDSLAAAARRECMSHGVCDSTLALADRGALYQIIAGAGRRLYALHVLEPFGGKYEFFLYVRGRLSPNTVAINGHELEGTMPVRQPLVSFNSPWSGAEDMFVVEEPVHNGTDANELEYHYYSAGVDLVLHELFVIPWDVADSVVQSVLTDTARGGVEDFVAREPRALTRDTVQVDVSLVRPGLPTTVLGYYLLVRARPDSTFRVANPTPRLARYRCLLTGLQEGCSNE